MSAASNDSRSDFGPAGWKWRLAQRLEIRWWRKYLLPKDKQTYLGWKKNYWQQFLQQLQPGLQLKTGQRVLDAGCGPAGIFTALENQSVTAVDPLLNEYIKLPHFHMDDYPHVQFIHSTIEDYKSVEAFHMVFCLNVINHVQHPLIAIRNFHQALIPSGHLVLSVDVHRHSLLKQLFRLIPADALHPHQHSLNDYRRLLLSEGFLIKQTIRLKREAVFDYYVLVAEKL